MIGRGPLTVRDLRELGVRLHEVMGIQVEDRLVAVTDSRRALRIICEHHGTNDDRYETEFINPHVYRAHVSLARVA